MIQKKIEKNLLQNAINIKQMEETELVSICGSVEKVKQYLWELQKTGYIVDAVKEYSMPRGININTAYTITALGIKRLQYLSRSRLCILISHTIVFLAGVFSAVLVDVGKDYVLHLLKHYLGE